MAAHHVNLRRFCPNPLDVDSITGRVLPQTKPGSSGAHLSTMHSYFYPSERLSLERANTIELGRCTVSYLSFSHTREEAAMR